MRNVKIKNLIRLLLLLATLAYVCDAGGSRSSSRRKSTSYSRRFSKDLKNAPSSSINNRNRSKADILLNSVGVYRNSRQIQPKKCHIPGSDSEGICMFVFDCNQASGTHLGICRDSFYIGSCCKLPEDPIDIDDSDNQIDVDTVPSKTKPSTTSTTVSPIVEVHDKNKTKITTTTTTEPTSTTTTTTTTIKPSLSLNRTEYRDGDFFSENGTLIIRDPKLICGRQFLPASRIVGGNDAYYGKWPWQVSIRTWQNEARTFIHSCGAALINENWAVTAAHCVDKVLKQDLMLRIGEFDLSDTDVPFNYTERRVQLVIPHPKFFGPSKTFEYDLALLRFYEPITFQPNIVPICIPEGEDEFVGRTGVVTGWGRLYEGGPIPVRLNEVQVPIMTNDECERMFLKAGYHEKIPHIFMCAGWPDGGKDSCEGDSGGPMVLQTGPDNHWSLAGVISWGIGCSRVSHPGVYTRITEFRDWINLVSEF